MYKWLYISVQLSNVFIIYLRSEIIIICLFWKLRMWTESVTAWRVGGRQLHDITNTSRLRYRWNLLPDLQCFTFHRALKYGRCIFAILKLAVGLRKGSFWIKIVYCTGNWNFRIVKIWPPYCTSRVISYSPAADRDQESSLPRYIYLRIKLIILL